MSHSLAPHILPLDRSLQPALQRAIDGKTKPLGALGLLEGLALQLGLVQGTLRPQIVEPHILVCAGDHGAARHGISAYPQDVTWQMVENFLAGGAAINVLARQAGLSLVVADAGVNHDFGQREQLLDVKVAPGTASYLDGAAMTAPQCAQAIEQGRGVVRKLRARGCNVLGLGEMGIGNTASAALIMHCLTKLPLEHCTGRGTGLDDAGLRRKLELLERALAAWPSRNSQPFDVLARFGGFEIAMLVGAMLAAAEERMTIVVDGFIVTSALLVAHALAPAVLDYCVFAHRSQEQGHRLQLEFLKARPLLDMDLRLGEGTGAALAMPLLRSACAILSEMASFESARVSEKTP